jgi:hypothetical protein
MSEWKTIDDAARSGITVDLWRPAYGGERCCEYRWVHLPDGNGYFKPVRGGYVAIRDATHYIPVPAPPEA